MFWNVWVLFYAAKFSIDKSCQKSSLLIKTKIFFFFFFYFFQIFLWSCRGAVSEVCVIGGQGGRLRVYGLLIKSKICLHNRPLQRVREKRQYAQC